LDEAKAIIWDYTRTLRSALQISTTSVPWNFSKATYTIYSWEALLTLPIPPDPDDGHGEDDPQTEDNSTEMLTFLTSRALLILVTWLMSCPLPSLACKRHQVHG